MAGYRAAFDEAGIAFENVVQQVGNFSITGGYQAMGELLQASPRPTAVLCLNDRMAFGAIQRVMAEGLRVPEDISILGYDDIVDSAFFNPPLTTVRQPAREMGIKAAEMLFELIERKHQRKASPDHGHDPVTFSTELVIRHSATTPGGGDANLSST
jgi:DNA-binding LacI/PurR family transcriptional regulator